MKVISETCHAHLIQYLHLYWCEVPDESYFRNVSCTLNSISTFVLMWGIWWKLFQKLIMHLNSISTCVLMWGTWWKLFQKLIMQTYFNTYICIDVRYLLNVISETWHAHLIQYLHLYLCEVPDESYFRNVSCTLNSISTCVLMWGTWWRFFSETCDAHLIQYLHLY